MCHWVRWQMECIWREVQKSLARAFGPHPGPGVEVGSCVSPFRLGIPQGRAASLSSDLPEVGLRLSHQPSTSPACALGWEEAAGERGRSPSQHGVQQNAQAPDVTAFIVALAFQHLAARKAGEGG